MFSQSDNRQLRAGLPGRGATEVSNYGEPALDRLSPQFDALYAEAGRPSIPPEKLLRALLLQALFTIRSERQLMQQITYNMLFRWFVGLAMDVAVWDVTVFTKNRDRLLEGDIACEFLAAILADPRSSRCSRPSISRWTAH